MDVGNFLINFLTPIFSQAFRREKGKAVTNAIMR